MGFFDEIVDVEKALYEVKKQYSICQIIFLFLSFYS